MGDGQTPNAPESRTDDRHEADLHAMLTAATVALGRLELALRKVERGAASRDLHQDLVIARAALQRLVAVLQQQANR